MNGLKLKHYMNNYLSYVYIHLCMAYLTHFHVFCSFHGLPVTAELTPSVYLHMAYSKSSIA